MYNKFFTKLDNVGHECSTVERDDLVIFIPGDSKAAIIRRWIRERFLISERNYRSYKYMRSRSAINYERSRHIRQYYYMIHPFSDVRIGFEIIMIVVYITSLFFVVYDSAFNQHSDDYDERYMHEEYAILVLDILCIGGIVVNFFTGYHNEETHEIYLTHSFAAWHYFRTYFWWDLISSMPIHMIHRNEWEEVPRITVDVLSSAARVIRLKPLLKYFHNTAEVFDMGFFCYKSGRLLFLVMLFLHWGACFHYFMARSVNGRDCDHFNPQSWLITDGICKQVEDRWNNYFASLFRSFSNTFRVGHGLYTPVTNEDMIVSVCVAVIGHIMIYTFIAKIMHLANARHSSRTKYREMHMQLEDYALQKKLPHNMRQRLAEYYDFRFQKSYYEENDILSEIPPNLKEDIVLHSCRRLVENVSFFNNIPMALLIRIVTILRREIYLANDMIIKAGLVGDSMFFIKAGTVAVYTSTGKEVCHLEGGAHFGEIALVMNDSRVASVVAVENCEIYRLDKKEFQSAISPFPDLLSRIEQVATARMERTIEMDSENRMAKRNKESRKDYSFLARRI